MILGNNHIDRETKELIDDTVGKKYSWRERFRRKGIGTSRMRIVDASEEIKSRLGKNQDLKYMNVEMRPKGLIVYFNNKINNYLWLLPQDKIQLSRTGQFKISDGENWISLETESVLPGNAAFFNSITLLTL